MIRVEKTGRRGFTVFGRDPTGSMGTRHFPGLADVLAHGTQSVVPPTAHPSGRLYGWTTDATLLNTPLAHLPIFNPDIADKLADKLAPWLTRSPRQAPVRRPLRPCELSEQERLRQRHYVEAIIADELPRIAAMAANSGRNTAAFHLVCRVGRWVHHGIIGHDRLVADVIAACRSNGLMTDDGPNSILATISSGLAKSAGDTLPALGARHD